MELGLIITIGSGLLAAGAAWGGAKTALNGTRERVKGLAVTLAEHVSDDRAVQRELLDRLIRIETKLDQTTPRGNTNAAT